MRCRILAVEVDPNGKAMPWLWVTLLPFIDEKRLLKALHEAESQLSDVEKVRNRFGQCRPQAPPRLLGARGGTTR